MIDFDHANYSNVYNESDIPNVSKLMRSILNITSRDSFMILVGMVSSSLVDVSVTLNDQTVVFRTDIASCRRTNLDIAELFVASYIEERVNGELHSRSEVVAHI